MPRKPKKPVPPPAGYLWTPDAARRIGLSVKTLWNYRALGRGPTSKPIGRKLAWPIEDLDAWLDAEMNPKPDADRAHESRPAEPRVRRGSRAAA
ncbi:helix-turn-helix domain-containing protein [Streptomyces sp. SID8352]|uniref:helix-turn-helix domain-containing protein n=1 Tax=Streptomyces sp. SID8352 TaxID=2690338 RepID=UPI00136EFEA5|nr:helix-turn-helix domain-containing protein [Streptomyces sp. SID8352]